MPVAMDWSDVLIGTTTLTFTRSVGDDPAMAGEVGPGRDYYLDMFG